MTDETEKAEGTDETKGSLNAERLRRMEEIADGADRVKVDLQDLDGTPITGPGDDEDDGPGDERVEKEPAARRFKLKVNGVEREVSEEELIALGQKVASADEYLKSAAEAVKNASKLDLADKEDPAKVEEDDLALARALQMGSEEDAAKAIRQLRARPSEVTPDAVVRAVDERLTFRKAADWFNDEYKELLSDPILKSLVYQKDAELAEREPTLSYTDRLKRVGDEVREWVGKVRTPKSDKLTRKASVAPVPVASGRQQVASDDEGEEDPEKVIAEMAKGRRQERPVRH